MPWDHFDFDWLSIIARASGWALVLARVTGLCLTAPILAAPGLDARFRVGLSALLTVLIAPVAVAAQPESSSGFMVAAIAEILTGAILGWAAGLIIAGAQLAGDLVSAQAGLSASTFFDPDTGEELTALGKLYGWVALVVFVSIDGPLMLVRAVAQSFQPIPAGKLFEMEPSLTRIFVMLVEVLELALRAATPAMIALVIAGMVIGWLSRAAPSFPLLALTLPVRTMVGVFLVLLGLSSLAITLSAAWGAIGFASLAR